MSDSEVGGVPRWTGAQLRSGPTDTITAHSNSLRASVTCTRYDAIQDISAQVAGGVSARLYENEVLLQVQQPLAVSGASGLWCCSMSFLCTMPALWDRGTMQQENMLSKSLLLVAQGFSLVLHGPLQSRRARRRLPYRVADASSKHQDGSPGRDTEHPHARAFGCPNLA